MIFPIGPPKTKFGPHGRRRVNWTKNLLAPKLSQLSHLPKLREFFCNYGVDGDDDNDDDLSGDDDNDDDLSGVMMMIMITSQGRKVMMMMVLMVMMMIMMTSQG